MLLEVFEFLVMSLLFCIWLRRHSGLVTRCSKNALVIFPVGSTLSFWWISRIVENSGLYWSCFYDCDIGCCFSCQEFDSIPICRRLTVSCFGELAPFIYCLVRRIKKSSCLPFLDQWEREYVTLNDSRVPAITEQDFLAGTRVMKPPNKVGNHDLNTVFHRDSRNLLDELVNCLLSTVASKLLVGQRVGCFCTTIVIDADDVAPIQRFNKLVDELLKELLSGIGPDDCLRICGHRWHYHFKPRLCSVEPCGDSECRPSCD